MGELFTNHTIVEHTNGLTPVNWRATPWPCCCSYFGKYPAQMFRCNCKKHSETITNNTEWGFHSFYFTYWLATYSRWCSCTVHWIIIVISDGKVFTLWLQMVTRPWQWSSLWSTSWSCITPTPSPRSLRWVKGLEWFDKGKTLEVFCSQEEHKQLHGIFWSIRVSRLYLICSIMLFHMSINMFFKSMIWHSGMFYLYTTGICCS